MATSLRPRGGRGRVVNWADSSFHSLSIFSGSCDASDSMSSSFSVAALKKKEENQTILSQRPCLPCFTQFSAKPMDPACLAQNSSNVSAFAFETRPMSFLASPSQLTSASPTTWHEMLPAHPTTHLPPVHRPRPPVRRERDPPFPCFHGRMTDALQRPRRPRRPRPRPASPCSCRRPGPVSPARMKIPATGGDTAQWLPAFPS